MDTILKRMNGMEAGNKRLKMELGKIQKANKEMEESAKFLSDTFEECKNIVSEIKWVKGLQIIREDPTGGGPDQAIPAHQ